MRPKRRCPTMTQMPHLTATYENGVLKLLGRLPDFTNGDRVEIAVVRVSPVSAGGGAEQMEKEQQERPPLPPDDEDDYDVLEAMNATRLRQGERPLIPPGGAR